MNNIETLANKVYTLIFTDYSFENIAKEAGVSTSEVQAIFNERTDVDERSMRHLVPVINRLYQNLSFN